MKIAPLIGLTLLATHANAFDAWGFHSGMSEDQASAVARQQGYEAFVPAWPPSTQRFHNLSFSRKGADGSYELGYMASFCDGRLMWLSHDYKPGIGTLFELINELKATYGEPVAATSSSVITEGHARSIDFNFHPKPDDVASIAVNLNLQNETDFGIQVIHKTGMTGCAGPAPTR